MSETTAPAPKLCVEYWDAETRRVHTNFRPTAEEMLAFVAELLANEDIYGIELFDRKTGADRLEARILADRQERDEKERAERLAKNTPVVGKGATEHLYTDARAYAVVAVGKATAEDGRPKTIKILHLDPQALGIEVGPLKNYDDDRVIGHYFTDAEIELALAGNYDPKHVETARLRKDGRYYASHGCPLSFTHATDLTDHRF